jgi:hypothetical protein
MRRNGSFAAAIGGAFFVVATAVPALSGVIQFGSNYFEYVSDPGVSWATAQTNAASRSYLGATGYLAVVTSAAENNFLAANFTISTTSFEGALARWGMQCFCGLFLGDGTIGWSAVFSGAGVCRRGLC